MVQVLTASTRQPQDPHLGYLVPDMCTPPVSCLSPLGGERTAHGHATMLKMTGVFGAGSGGGSGVLSRVVPGEVLVPHSMVWTESKAPIGHKLCGRRLGGRETGSFSLTCRDSNASCLTTLPPSPMQNTHTHTLQPMTLRPLLFSSVYMLHPP